MFYLYVIDNKSKRLTIFQPAIRSELASKVLESWSCDEDSICGLWPASKSIPSWLLSPSLGISFEELEFSVSSAE